MRLKSIVALLTVISLMLFYSCKIQEAPGAYEQAVSLPSNDDKEADTADDVLKQSTQVVEEVTQPVVQPVVTPVVVDTVVTPPVVIPIPKDTVVSVPAVIDTPVVVQQTAVIDTPVVAKQPVEVAQPIAPPVAEIKEEPKPVVKENTRQEKFEVVVPSDKELLKNYHVVIGSFGVQANAEGLKTRMSGEYSPVVVKNERNMYRVILISLEDYESARQAIEKVKNQFPDAWILING